MSEVGLDIEAFRKRSRNMQRAYVRGPGGNNAVPGVMTRKFIGETTGKVISLANIYRLPIPVSQFMAENIDAGTRQIDRPDCVVLGFVARS
jgi:hypothetical protein